MTKERPVELTPLAAGGLELRKPQPFAPEKVLKLSAADVAVLREWLKEH
jgi:hypothetical protein